MPASSRGSSAEPTFTQAWKATTGAAWFSSRTTSSPLGRRKFTNVLAWWRRSGSLPRTRGPDGWCRRPPAVRSGRVSPLTVARQRAAGQRRPGARQHGRRRACVVLTRADGRLAYCPTCSDRTAEGPGRPDLPSPHRRHGSAVSHLQAAHPAGELDGRGLPAILLGPLQDDRPRRLAGGGLPHRPPPRRGGSRRGVCRGRGAARPADPSSAKGKPS